MTGALEIQPVGEDTRDRTRRPLRGDVTAEYAPGLESPACQLEEFAGIEVAAVRHRRLEAVRLESKRTIDLVQFVDASEIDQRYYERPYYLLPADEQASEGYSVIREALRKTGKIAVGQVTLGGREHLGAGAPVDNGLVLNLTRYANELRPADRYFDTIPERKLDRDMLDMALQLVERKTAPFDADAFSDSYSTALRELVKAKASGRTIVATEAPAPADNVVDLMEALRRSVQPAPVQIAGMSAVAAPATMSSPRMTTKSTARIWPCGDRPGAASGGIGLGTQARRNSLNDV